MSLLNSLLEAIGRLFGRTPEPPAQHVTPPSSPPTHTTSAPLTAAERKCIVSLTPAAVRELKKVMSRQPLPYFRVSTEASMDRFAYRMNFDDHIAPGCDYVYEFDGVTVVVDGKNACYLEGTTLDYVDDGNGKRGFCFDNPNAARG